MGEYNGPIPAEIESDRKRLKQILVNLLGNAIKFTEQGSVRLVVRFLAGDEPRIQFDVIDTGIGIGEQQQAELFEPFSQADSSVDRAFGGTGLGLAISQRLASMLGGEITLRSEPGRGSTFSFAIATGDMTDIQLIEPPLDAVEEDSPLPGFDRQLKCHVLVVDDRRDVRFLAKHLLTKAGADVTEAEDGRKAVAAIRQMMDGGPAFDLVLLDMQMPRLDGYQTAARLRKMGFRTPIIALTADAMHGDMDRCLSSGCDAYLSKPIDAELLLNMVADYIGRTTSGELREERPRSVDAAAAAKPSIELEKNRILIVDDSVDACTAIQRLLQIEGFEVQAAYDGKTAIELAKTFLPHIAILDITLRDMDGYQVVQSLKAIPELHQTKFFALTGHGSRRRRQTGDGRRFPSTPDQARRHSLLVEAAEFLRMWLVTAMCDGRSLLSHRRSNWSLDIHMHATNRCWKVVRNPAQLTPTNDEMISERFLGL